MERTGPDIEMDTNGEHITKYITENMVEAIDSTNIIVLQCYQNVIIKEVLIWGIGRVI